MLANLRLPSDWIASTRARLGPAVLCAIAAVTVAIVGVGSYLNDSGGRVAILVHMSASEPMADVARGDPDFAFVDPGAHYDGVYFYAMARDPLALGREHTLIDAAANRYGHPAYGWLAGLLSLGQLRLLPWALLLIGLASLYVAALAASDLAVVLGLSPWFGLAIAFNPGLIYAVTADTSEAFGAALLLVVLWAWLTGRRGTAAILLVPLCFAKEPLLAVPVGIGLFEILRAVRARTPVPALARRLAPLLPGLALYTVWLLWVHARFGVFPFEQGLDRLSIPFTGWADTLSRAADLAVTGFGEMQAGQAALGLLPVAFGAIAVGTVVALRLRTPLDAVFVATAALMVSLGWLPLLYPKDLIRVMAFVLVLLPFILASRGVPADEERAANEDQAADRDRRALTGSGGTGSTR